MSWLAVSLGMRNVHADHLCTVKTTPRQMRFVDQEGGDEVFDATAFEVSCKDIWKENGELMKKPAPVRVRVCNHGTFDPVSGGCMACPSDQDVE